ncbi:MAG: hypothetical protein ACI86H_001606 [bacterium]|jgi:hypothetical protein
MKAKLFVVALVSFLVSLSSPVSADVLSISFGEFMNFTYTEKAVGTNYKNKEVKGQALAVDLNGEFVQVGYTSNPVNTVKKVVFKASTLTVNLDGKFMKMEYTPAKTVKSSEFVKVKTQKTEAKSASHNKALSF